MRLTSRPRRFLKGFFAGFAAPLIGFLLLSWIVGTPESSAADASAPPAESGVQDASAPGKPWYDKIPWQWNGQVKARGSASWPGDRAVFEPVGAGTYYDGNIESRINNKLFLEGMGYFETQYEIVFSGGDTRSKQFELAKLFPDLFKFGTKFDLIYDQPIDDDRRLMNLTHVIDESDDYVLYHRLDRLSLTLKSDRGVVRLGRQVITWGNGMIFNPMDLINPFAPTDIERDYKVGDDMAFVEFAPKNIGNLQAIYRPGRDLISEDVAWDQSSVGGKFHMDKGNYGFDAMATIHYEDLIGGLGSTGQLWDGAWRINATWTHLEDDTHNSDYLSLVANYDSSWTIWNKNVYGLLEYFFNGLGDTDYEAANLDPDIAKRISRGDLFVLGRNYISGTINVEAHPLVNLYLTVINNMDDPSGTILPQAVINTTENTEVRIGSTLFYGSEGTEFGGFQDPETDLFNKTPNDFFIWLFYFF
ncbi:MAG: hypothetical protein GY850_47740 [bacterium]|nr:hypothetical protein [bacterium]